MNLGSRRVEATTDMFSAAVYEGGSCRGKALNYKAHSACRLSEINVSDEKYGGATFRLSEGVRPRRWCSVEEERGTEFRELSNQVPGRRGFAVRSVLECGDFAD